MRILMVSPQPFFEARGAPLLVYQHIKALITLGYQVDLVTYHLGKEVSFPGLRIFRAPSIPFIRTIKPGPSLVKILLDLFIFVTLLRRLCTERYRYIYAHEEGALLSSVLAGLFHCRLLYYMHCDLPELLTSSHFVKNRLVLYLINRVQDLMVRRADAVITLYPELQASAHKRAPNTPIYLIVPSAVDEEIPSASEADVDRLRRHLKIAGGPILLYTGTLEAYQGLDLLVQSIQSVARSFPTVRYVIVGGGTRQVASLRKQAEQAGVIDYFSCVGQRPLEEMPAYMALADVLVSPRSEGTHTPLKLYTYLRAGKPILATQIVSHTQILTPDIALLVPPTPEALAEGALTLLRDAPRARQLGASARLAWQKQYSWLAFLQKCWRVYSEFSPLGQ